MIDRVLRPLAEGFRDSVNLWKGIILALFSVVSVVAAFVNAPSHSSDSDIPPRSH